MSRLVIELDERMHGPFLKRAEEAFRSPQEQARWELALRIEDRLEPRQRLGELLAAHAAALARLADMLQEPPERAPWVLPSANGDGDEA